MNLPTLSFVILFTTFLTFVHHRLRCVASSTCLSTVDVTSTTCCSSFTLLLHRCSSRFSTTFTHFCLRSPRLPLHVYHAFDLLTTTVYALHTILIVRYRFTFVVGVYGPRYGLPIPWTLFTFICYLLSHLVNYVPHSIPYISRYVVGCYRFRYTW